MATNNIKDFRFNVYINDDGAIKTIGQLTALSEKYQAVLEKLGAANQKNLASQKSVEEQIAKQTERRDALVKKIDQMVVAGKSETSEYRKLQTQLDGVNNKITTHSGRLQNLKSEYLSNERQTDQTRQALEKVRRELDAGNKGIKISEMILQQLREAKAALNREYAKAIPGSEHWNKLKGDIQAVNLRMDQLKVQNNQVGLSIGKIANSVNKYIGLITMFVASLTGIVMGVRKTIDAYAQWDDKLADVMKTTGLTKDQVKSLNSELAKIDTRTAQNDLLNLGRDAGKLGITGAKNIRDFVEAGDQINVALGEDLGEDAIKNIGKMVGVFKSSTKELQDLDLKEQMLAVGSAINELGANSTASEPYLVNFAGRLGGVAKQANISMDAILGYGSALDQDMQQVEMSATAFQNFIMKLMGDPAKFARLAGLEVNKFTTLLNTDANAAIKQVLTSLNQKGGFQALIPIFEEMGLDGTRATGVLSAMAGSIDKIEAAQTLANQAMREGISVTNEFNTKNNTAQAQLEKARKGFTQMSVELGEKLAPAMTFSTNGLSYFLRTLKITIEFVASHRTAIITLTAALAGYTIAAKAAALAESLKNKESRASMALAKANIIWKNAWIVADKALAAVSYLVTGNVKKATVALKEMNLVLKMNPWGLVGAAILGAIALLIALRNSVKEVSETQKAMNDVSIKTQENMAGEKLQLDILLAVARDEKRSKDERLAAIQKLNEISPEYLGNLNLETINTQKGKEAIDQYVASLEKKAKAEALYEELKELDKKKREAENSEADTSWWQDVKAAVASGGNQLMGQTMQVRYAAQNKQQQLAEIEKARQAILNEMKKTDFISLSSVTTDTTNTQTTTYTPTTEDTDTHATGKQFGMTGKGKKKHFSPEKFREDYQAWIEKTIDEEISQAEEDVNKALKDQGIDMSNASDQVGKQIKKDVKNAQGETFKNIKKDMESDLDQKKTKINADPTLQENDKNKQIYDAEKNHLEEMKKLYELYDQDISEIDRKMAEAKTEYNEAIRKAALERSQTEIKAGYEAGEAAVESANTFKEATQNVLNSIRSAIKAKLAEGLAVQLVNVLKTVPFPFNFAAAAAASAAFSALYDSVVPQFDEGRYPVIGEKDGKTYYPDYQDAPRTGLYTRPTLIKGLGLVAENKSEIVISNPHVKHLQMNYPDVIRTIYRTATRAPQFDDGNYPNGSRTTTTQSQKNTEKEDMMIALLQRIAASSEKPFKGYITYNDVNDAINDVKNIEDSLG